MFEKTNILAGNKWATRCAIAVSTTRIPFEATFPSSSDKCHEQVERWRFDRKNDRNRIQFQKEMSVGGVCVCVCVPL